MQTIERFRLPTQRLQEGMRFDLSQRYQGTILLRRLMDGIGRLSLNCRVSIVYVGRGRRNT